MKTAKLIARIILSPLIFVIVFVLTLIVAVNNLILFARYGGEMITYKKEDHVMVFDIYELLKKEYADRKVVDETIPDFPDCRMCLFFDNVDYDVICDDCIESNKFKNKETTDSNYKWNDIINDPDNKGQTITEKEYLLRRGVDVDKFANKRIKNNRNGGLCKLCTYTNVDNKTEPCKSCIDGEMDNFIPAYPSVTQPPRPIVKKEDSTPKKGIIKPDSILVKSDPYCSICFKSDFCNIKNDNVIPSWCPFKKAMDEHFIFLNKSKP